MHAHLIHARTDKKHPLSLTLQTITLKKIHEPGEEPLYLRVQQWLLLLLPSTVSRSAVALIFRIFQDSWF